MDEKVRQSVLGNHDRSPWVQIYATAQSSRDFPEREEFLFLMWEAERSFKNGCPRASMVTAGEALQKVVLNIVRHHLAKVGSARIGGKSWTSQDIYSDRFVNKTTFNMLLKSVKEHDLVKPDTLAKMFVVKDLRNAAAHGNWPLITIWDPEVPDKLFKDFLEDHYQVPEGYWVWLHGDWFQFGCEDYDCGSLQHLDPYDRLAAIELFIANDIMKRLLVAGVVTQAAPPGELEAPAQFQVYFKSDRAPGSRWDGPHPVASLDEGVALALERGPRCPEAVVVDANDMLIARADDGVLVFRVIEDGKILYDGRIINLREAEGGPTEDG